MKILIISDAWHPQINGVVRTYEYIKQELEKMGHDVRVLGPADFPWRLPMPGYSEIKLALFPYAYLEKLTREFGPDYIHLATEGPLGWAGRKYCARNNIIFSSSYHTHFPDYMARRIRKFLPFLARPVHEIAKRWVRKFHAPSRGLMLATASLEQELKDWGFKAPIFRLSRGVLTEQFYPGEKTLFKDLPKPIAIYVGRVAIEKSIEDFLEMPWTGSKIVVGDGPELQELKTKYPSAIFTGSKTGAELGAHYRSADVFVFPSRTDTFGMVLIEALASGLPVAAYNVTGPKDIITEPFLGVLNDNLSLAALEAMKQGAAQQRSEYAKTHYTWEHAARQFMIAAQNR